MVDRYVYQWLCVWRQQNQIGNREGWGGIIDVQLKKSNDRNSNNQIEQKLLYLIIDLLNYLNSTLHLSFSFRFQSAVSYDKYINEKQRTE